MVEMINVALNFGSKNIKVGRLVTLQKRIYFEFDQLFIDSNLAISPYQHPSMAHQVVFLSLYA
jgi:hypothetical protein